MTGAASRKQQVIVAVCGGLILLAGARTLRSGCGGGGSFTPEATPADRYAAVWSEEIGALLQGAGDVVILYMEYANTKAHTQARVDALAAELARTRIRVRDRAGYRSSQFGPLPAPDLFPRDWFMDQVRRHPKVAAIVLVSSVPALEPADLQALRRHRPRLVFAADSMDVRGVRELMEAGLLDLAFMPRYQPLPDDPDTDSPRGWFNLYYQVVYGPEAH
jgi:hypothetical protein